MELGQARSSLNAVEKQLQRTMNKREKVIKESRDVITSCSKAIVHMHTKKFDDAKKELENAGRLLAVLREGLEPGLFRYLISPETEFVEASTLNAVLRGKSIPSASTLGVGPEGYMHGLLDSIGEMKRLILDSIMEGNTPKAKEFFELMEKLYGFLSPFAAFDNVVGGTRRKIDVARILIEDIRGVLAEEVRRGSLVSSMERLQKRLGTGRRR